jgi:homoserine kinase
MQRRRLVRVPATSANLGPGFDVLAAAVSLHLELEVEETGEFAVAAPALDVPLDRTNLCVRAFELLHSADGIRFTIDSAIPLAAGLGSSASAIVAGLVAADHLYELGLTQRELLALAVELEGHPDNVAAALEGGFVACVPTPGSDSVTAVRLNPPNGIEAVLVLPEEEVSTAAAREALPAEVLFADAAANVAAVTSLVLGIERSDLALIQAGLADRLHQPHRARLYPRSMEIAEAAGGLGALGATISGAGPTVLVWSFWQQTGLVVKALQERCAGWADVVRVPFEPRGADVVEI